MNGPHARINVSPLFDADYVDIFEVRGMHREKRGTKLNPVLDKGSVTLGYKGLDKKVRNTRLARSVKSARERRMNS